jgi:hypothetical protein
MALARARTLAMAMAKETPLEIIRAYLTELGRRKNPPRPKKQQSR